MSSVIRRAEDKRWSPELIEKIKGTPKEPVPGSGKSNLVAYYMNKENLDREKVEYVRREIPDEPEVRPNYIFKKDVEKYGATEGCPGCRALLNPFSKYRAKHTQECTAGARPTASARKLLLLRRGPPEAEAPLEAPGAGRGLRGGAGPATAGAQNFARKPAGA